MSIFQLFRSFLPLRNPMGFGASDFIELTIALLLVFLVVFGAWIEPLIRRFAANTRWCMIGLAALPIALRLVLLPTCPVPAPSGADDFSYILLGDTLRHLRFANPTPPLHEFFESTFILLEPAYSSIYPLGQGSALAIGKIAFGHFWIGVVFSTGALSALCYWMLRAWTTAVWAFLGGLFAAAEFGPLNQWMNSYWGGTLSAAAGCLVFGALPRFRQSARMRDGVLLGLGLALEWLTRPFEFCFLLLSTAIFVAPILRHRAEWRRLARPSAAALLVLLSAAALTLLQNKAVTGNWATLPYALSRYQYGVPTTLTFQPNPIPHRALTPEQELDYKAQSAIHGDGKETAAAYFARFTFRLRYLRFFLFAPLYVAVAIFVVTIRGFHPFWVVLTILLFLLGTNFYPYFYPHYIAATTCLFVLASVEGLARVSTLRIGGQNVGRRVAQALILVCGAQFLFWYDVHLYRGEELWPLANYETWDYINFGDFSGRNTVDSQLAAAGGKQLVFVRYWPRHRFEEWIHNDADMKAANIVWACDLGTAENEKLLRLYPDRGAWLLEPDAQPPRLQPYQSGTGIFETVH